MKKTLFLILIVILMLVGCENNTIKDTKELEFVDGVPATCLEAGHISYYIDKKTSKLYKDSNGSEEITTEDIVLAKLEHNLTKTEAKEPTCLEGGNVEYYTCSICGKNYDKDGLELTDVALDKINHNLTLVDAVSPLCETDGNIAYYHCSLCNLNYDANGNLLENVKLNKLEHNLTHVDEKPSTCSTYGNISYEHCSVCGNNYDANGNKLDDISIPLVDHTLTYVEAKEATCAEYGCVAHYNCSVCGKNYDDSGNELVNVKLNKTSHSYKHVKATAPTCLKDGNIEYWHCSNCGFDYNRDTGEKYESVVDPKLDHEMTHYEYKKETCEEDGNKEYYYCSLCKMKYIDETGTETISSVILTKTGHNVLTKEAKEATCQEDGNISYKYCTNCNACWNLDNEIIEVSLTILEKVSHKFTNYTSNEDADYLHDGTKSATCDYNCGEISTIDDIGTKKVYPLVGKTYYNILFDSTKETNKNINGYSWGYATSFDESLTITGFAYPFRGYYEFIPTDNFGNLDVLYYSWVLIDVDSVKTYKDQGIKVYTNGESNYIVSDTYEECKAIYDFETGLLFYASGSSYAYAFILTDSKITSSSSSSFTVDNHNASAINVNGTNIFIYDDNIYFNVTFKDSDCFDIEASDCFNSKTLIVTKDEEIFTFVYADGENHLSDSYRGRYTYLDKEITFDGYKTVTIAKEYGLYEIIDGAIYITIGDKYYHAIIDGNNVTLEEEKVTISYYDGKNLLGSQEVFKNIPIELNNYDVLNYILIEWCLDKNLVKPVSLTNNKYIPTEDINLYGYYAEKVTINLVDENSTITEIVIGEGEVISTKLPDYSKNIYSNDGTHYFAGWYLDSEYTITLPESAEVSLADNGVTIYAKWEEVIAYVGTYKGNEIASKGYNGTTELTLTIDVNGNITGLVTGKVISYNANTQILKYQPTGSSAVKSFFLDANIGVIAGIYNDASIDTDFYYLSKYQGVVSADNRIAIYAPKEIGSDFIGYYLYIIDTVVDNNNTHKLVTVYLDHIYDNVSYETSSHVALTTLSDIKNTKTLIIKDLTDDSRLIGIYTDQTSIYETSSSKYIHVLDNYLGSYSNGVDTIYLDGACNITFEGKTGTYEIAVDKEYTFDVYVKEEETNIEHYELTINGTSYQLVKPIVTAKFISSQTQVADKPYNKDINYILPILENTDTHVFRGWYIGEELYTEYTPSDYNDVTFTALWKELVTVTINDENGTIVKTYEYGLGEELVYEKPIYEGFRFTGYYDQDGNLVENNTILSKSLTLTATWEEAPIYNNSYYFTFIKTARDSEEATGLIYVDDRTPIVNFDADGYAINPGTYPFTSLDVEIIQDVTYETTGKITLKTIHISTKEVTSYDAYVDLKTGLIVVYVDSTSLYFLSPYAYINSSSLNGSYWDNFEVVCCSYTYNENSVNFIVDNDTVTFGVTFKDNNSLEITGKECLKQKAVDICKNDSVLVTFGYYNYNMVRENDSKGTYTSESDTLVLNGISTATLNGVKGTYTSKAITNGYNIYLTIDNTYYTTSINTNDNTLAEIVKPMVSVTINLDGGSLSEPLTSLNTNIKVTLPTPTKDGYVFRGWYINGSTVAVYSTTPTKDITMSPKWLEEVKLTVNYETVTDHNFGYGTLVYSFGKGETIKFDYPKTLVDGYLITGFIKGSEEYTLGTIDSSFTISAIWQVASPFYGTWYGEEVFGTSTGETKYVNSGYQLDFDVDGRTSSTSRISYASVSYNDTHELYQLGTNVCAYDLEYGVLVANDRSYSYSSSGFNDEEEKYNYKNLGYDCYIFFKGRTATTDKNGCCFNNGYTRILDFTFEDDTHMIILIYNNNVYCNVRLETTDEITLTAANAYSVSNLNIYDDSNELIVSFTNVDGELEPII